MLYYIINGRLLQKAQTFSQLRLLKNKKVKQNFHK